MDLSGPVLILSLNKLHFCTFMLSFSFHLFHALCWVLPIIGGIWNDFKVSVWVFTAAHRCSGGSWDFTPGF